MNDIVIGGYYLIDDPKEKTPFVLKVERISSSDMIVCYEYNKNGKAIRPDRVTRRWFLKWAKMRVKQRKSADI